MMLPKVCFVGVADNQRDVFVQWYIVCGHIDAKIVLFAVYVERYIPGPISSAQEIKTTWAYLSM